jgi:hypothetical protein
LAGNTITIYNSRIIGNGIESVKANWSSVTGNAYGGGICHFSTQQLTISNSVIEKNYVSSPLGNAYGGGIYTTGNVTLTNTSILSNKAASGGGVYITNGANVAMTDFDSRNNIAQQGSGVAKMTGATLTLKRTSTNQTKVWGSSSIAYLDDGANWF